MKLPLSLFILAIGSASIVAGAAYLTRDKTKYNNSFVRIFPPHAADESNTINLEGNVSLVGITDEMVYLRDKADSNYIIGVDWFLKDKSRIHVDSIDNSEIFIEANSFFIQKGHSAKLACGRVGMWTIDTVFKDLPRFTEIHALSPNSLLLRSIDIPNRRNVFVKTIDPVVEHDILTRQVDGIFCTDGHLRYSSERSRLVYNYRYRNQFIVLDTNLNIVLEGKTIDTTSVARISVTETSGKLTMSRPPLIVNQNIAVSGKFLFVQSNLIAKNESIEKSSKHTVFDVYDILDGSYRFSFYLKNDAGSRVKNFVVKDSTLFALFSHRFSRYNVPSVYLKE